MTITHPYRCPMILGTYLMAQFEKQLEELDASKVLDKIGRVYYKQENNVSWT